MINGKWSCILTMEVKSKENISHIWTPWYVGHLHHNLHVPISNTKFHEPTCHHWQNWKKFLAENIFHIFSFICIFAFAHFMPICTVLDILLVNIHFIILTDFSHILQVAFLRFACALPSSTRSRSVTFPFIFLLLSQIHFVRGTC